MFRSRICSSDFCRTSLTYWLVEVLRESCGFFPVQNFVDFLDEFFAHLCLLVICSFCSACRTIFAAGSRTSAMKRSRKPSKRSDPTSFQAKTKRCELAAFLLMLRLRLIACFVLECAASRSRELVYRFQRGAVLDLTPSALALANS